jgi:membrane-bound lytic murein transglycosylase B
MSLISILIFCVSILLSPLPAYSLKKMTPDLNWSVQQLKKNNLNKSFIEVIQKNYDRKSFDKVIRLNTLGFLAPSNHRSLISDEAVKKSLEFLEKNKATFNVAQSDYIVPPEIITSLLWIETRHGSITGTFHVPSVYIHLLQLSRQKNQKYLFKVARKNSASQEMSTQELVKKISDRTEWRSKWALEQLLALEKIFLSKQKDIKRLKGSFAGAFGLPQFIPSSYRDFASSSTSLPPNLFTIEDSILSVARYLMIHGWSNTKEDQQIIALMKYNNSRDYAESIIELAKKVRKFIKDKKHRSLASQAEGGL